jgi:hypothetical protein
MNKVIMDYQEKNVLFYQIYTREPHPGQNRSIKNKDPRYDFTDKKQTQTKAERVSYATKMLEKFSQKMPVLIDEFGEDCVQDWLGGGAPNSLAIIDGEGKLALWQAWADLKELRSKLDEMTKTNP